MAKKASSYEKSLNLHEKTMNGLLKTVAHLAQYLYQQNLQNKMMPSQEDTNALFRLDFYEKMAKENYIFNSYESLRKLMAIVCSNNLQFSTNIIIHCLKNLTMYNDSIISYLEVLKELCLLQDNFHGFRKDLILGVPTILKEVDYLNKQKFGLQCEGNINKPMYE